MINLPDHLAPWSRFVKGMSPVLMSQLQDGETLTIGAQRLLLQGLYEAGCLRKPSTAEARREQKHANESRRQDG